MDYTPRTIMRMVQAGMEDEVLSSETIWTCASCYSCAVRCPRDIDITNAMVDLRNLAVARGYPAHGGVGRRGRVYNVNFMQIIRRLGRMYEAELVLRYHLKTNPLNLLKMAPVGLTMFLKRKLRLLPEPAEGRAEITHMFERLETEQRKGHTE
jgi:heterodisulfide reductase subunit C